MSIAPTHQTVAPRIGGGRAGPLRAAAAALGDWHPPSTREDPIEILQAHAARRMPDLASLRHSRMLASPLAFLRGSAAVMAADLATMPASGLEVQLCGDAHLCNFATLLAAGRRPVFDLLDFDETLRGPFEWDVKRLAASIAVAGADGGLSARATRRAVVAAAAEYRRAMRRFAVMPAPAARCAPISVEAGPSGLLVPVADPEAPQDGVVQRWLARYRAGLAPRERAQLDRHRLVGTGRRHGGEHGLGPREWVLRFAGARPSRPLVLQVREAHASVLAPYLRPAPHHDQGRRVVEGQRLVRATADGFLASTSGAAPDGVRRDLHVRRFRHAAGRPGLEHVTGDRLAVHASRCGATLARAHARSGDPVAITSYVGDSTFDEVIAAFAAVYAVVTANDHALLREAADAGAIVADGRR